MTDDPQSNRDGFVSRWARRKAQARSGTVEAEPQALPAVAPSPVLAATDPITAPVAPAGVETIAPAPPLPTLADVAQLTRESDYSRFVAAGVDEGVKRAAMKKLFTDPHYNLMDGLDTYIDDYGRPDPIPLAMLRSMNQSKFLRLFDEDEDLDDHEKKAQALTAAAATEPAKPTDDHADLRLQQDDAVGRPGPDQGAGA
jgi:hypothetical protein